MSVRKTISLVRDEIKLESQQAKATIVDGPGADGKKVRLGVIDLPSFYASEGVSATADVSLLLAKLAEANVQGIILDLRRNGGGSLDEAIKLTGLFFDYGPVVQTKDSEGRVQTSRDPDSLTRCDKPLIVLTSRMSASASELLAGAIQDYGRGIIVGDPSTFGKGTVQNMIQLASVMKELNLPTDGNPGALKLTIRKFYRPSGSSTQLKGVVPDIILPTPTSPMKLGEIEMSEALPWDQVPVARFDKQQRVEPYVAMLRRKSARRIAGDEEFVWLREDIERFRKRRDDPVVSLNEAERRREQKEQEHRLEERNRERARNKPAPETKYEITLKNVSAPGLPAPVSASSTNATLASTKTNHDALGDDDKPSVGDPVLDETKHILADYIDALTSH